MVEIKIDASPDYMAELIGVERMRNYKGTWKFYKNGDASTFVD